MTLKFKLEASWNLKIKDRVLKADRLGNDTQPCTLAILTLSQVSFYYFSVGCPKSYSTKLHLLTNDSSSHLKTTTLVCFVQCHCPSELQLKPERIPLLIMDSKLKQSLGLTAPYVSIEPCVKPGMGISNSSGWEVPVLEVLLFPCCLGCDWKVGGWHSRAVCPLDSCLPGLKA